MAVEKPRAAEENLGCLEAYVEKEVAGTRPHHQLGAFLSMKEREEEKEGHGHLEEAPCLGARLKRQAASYQRVEESDLGDREIQTEVGKRQAAPLRDSVPLAPLLRMMR